MMTKKLLFTFITVLTVASLLSSCGKDGDIGPAGPQGAAGPAGAQGGTGQTGQTGSANVIYSDWLPIPATATAALPYRKNFSFPAPAITQDIIDKGLVYAYLKQGTSVAPLPYSQGYGTNTETTGSFLTTVLLGVGSMSLNQDWLTPGTIPASFANATSVVGGWTHLRYIIIPGSIKTSISPKVDLRNYDEVKKYFNIL